MNHKEWDAFVGTLSRAMRELAQAIMRRFNHILSEDRNEHLDRLQRIDRRLDRHAARLAALEERELRDGAGG